MTRHDSILTPLFQNLDDIPAVSWFLKEHKRDPIPRNTRDLGQSQQLFQYEVVYCFRTRSRI
jgi:hypothetical protein